MLKRFYIILIGCFVLTFSLIMFGRRRSSHALHKQSIDCLGGSGCPDQGGGADGILRADGVAFSRHNLGVGGWPYSAQETSEICVFCHTPHHARTDTAPLWNRGNMASGYTLYASLVSTYNTSDFGSLSTGVSVSAACLSCHDGVTTWDNLINYPGKGTEDTDGGPSMGTATGFENAMTFTMGEGIVGSSSIDHMYKSTDSPCSLCHGESGLFYIGYKTLDRVIIGIDLTNDHPMNIVYSTDGTASLRDISTVISSIPQAVGGSKGFVPGSSSQLANDGLLRTTNYWAVAGFINKSATIKDLLKAGTAMQVGGADTRKYVECSSCHDPHYKNRTNPDIDHTYVNKKEGTTTPIPSFNKWNYYGQNHATTFSFMDEMNESIAAPTAKIAWYERQVDGLFLRRVGGNSYSGVCLTCHGK